MRRVVRQEPKLQDHGRGVDFRQIASEDRVRVPIFFGDLERELACAVQIDLSTQTKSDDERPRRECRVRVEVMLTWLAARLFGTTIRCPAGARNVV